MATPQTSAVAHTDRGLRYSTEYVWRLYASNEHGEGPASNEATLTTGSRPPSLPPSNTPPTGSPVDEPPGSSGSSEPVPPSQHRFSDVDPGSVLAPGIERAAGLGIMAAVEGDRFEPNRPITPPRRGPAAGEAVAGAGRELPRLGSDALQRRAGGQHCPGRCRLPARGRHRRSRLRHTRRDRVLNRAEAMTLLARIWRLAGNDCPEEAPNPFTDVADDSVHRDGIVCMHAVGVTAGTSSTTFSPARLLTRAQVAVLAARFYDAAEPSSTPASSGPPDPDTGQVDGSG